MSDTPTKKHYTGGVAMRSHTVFMQAGAFGIGRDEVATVKNTTIDEKTLSQLPWSPWGDNNLLPMQYLQDIETCGVLNSIIDGKARLGLGQGVKPALVHVDEETGQWTVDKMVDDAEILDFLEDNNDQEQAFAWLLDQAGFGWSACRYLLNKGGDKIVNYKRDDLTRIRFNKMDASGAIQRLWYSGQWDKVRTPNDNRVFWVPNLRDYSTYQDLVERAAAGQRQFALALRKPGWNKHYYPIPLWMAAVKWVKIAQAVPTMKQALFENSMRPLFKVIIMEGYWEKKYGEQWPEDEDAQQKLRDQFYDDINDWLVGKLNQGKTLFVNGQFVGADGDKVVTDLDIIPIDNPTKPGELLPDSAAANTEIAIAMLWNNAVTGGNQKHGQYGGNEGGSNVREGTLLQTIVHEHERYTVARFMNPIKRFNGWTERLQKKGRRLEFVWQTTVMTTLDKGKNSEPVTSGNINTKKKKTNVPNENDSRD